MSARSHPFRAIGAVLVALVMVPAGIVGLAGVASDTGEMRPIMGMLLGAAILGIGGAVRTLFDVVAARKFEGQAATAARAELPATAIAHDGPSTLLGRWSISDDAARTFADEEWARRKREVALVAAIIFVGGSALLYVTQNGPVWAACAAGGFVSVLYLAIGLAKYAIERESAIRLGGDVVVWTNAILVLGTHHAFSQLTSVELGNGNLSLGIRWKTRSGVAHDTLQVPVPEHAWPVAVQVALALRERMGR